MEDPEFLIIGSGPGGTAAALKLVRAGRRVLMIEKGPFLPKEADNRDSKAVYGDKKYRTSDRWIDKDGEEFQPWMHYYVGGNAKLYGAALYRFRKADFQEITYPEGLSPAWPIAYEDLDRFYDEAEELYSVHGDREADPTEPTTAPYPLAPLPDEKGMSAVKEHLLSAGVESIPLPVGVSLKSRNERWDVDLSHFDAYPDPSLAKGEPEGCALPELLENSDVFELRTDCEARKFLSDSGRVAGVELSDGEVLTAQHYICAAGAINSAALFLNSEADGSFANSSGLVGKNYMCHICTTASAVFAEPHGASFAKTYGTNHWYQPDQRKVLHGSVQTQGKWDAAQYALEKWTHDEGEDLESLAARSFEFFFMTEDLPAKENAVTLTEDGRIKIERDVLGMGEHELLVEKFEKSLSEGTVLQLERFRHQVLPVSWCTHQCGTLKFGDDPQTSVLNRMCRAHDVQNLTVLDASFFPSSSALNPTLTIVANALRVGEHLAVSDI